MCSIKRRRSAQQLETQETAGDCITTHYIYYSRPQGFLHGQDIVMLNPVQMQQEQPMGCVMAEQEQGKCLWKLSFFGLFFVFFLIFAC